MPPPGRPLFPPRLAFARRKLWSWGSAHRTAPPIVDPAVNQYENCLRCHGTSTGKKTSVNLGYLPVRVVSATDRLNVIPEFDSTLRSTHPVFHDRSSMLPQPSLRLQHAESGRHDFGTHHGYANSLYRLS